MVSAVHATPATKTANVSELHCARQSHHEMYRCAPTPAIPDKPGHCTTRCPFAHPRCWSCGTRRAAWKGHERECLSSCGEIPHARFLESASVAAVPAAANPAPHSEAHQTYW